MYLSKLSGDDYVNVIARNQHNLASSCFDGHLARATPDNVAEMERFLEDTGVLVYSDLAGAIKEAVEISAATRGQEAGTACETNVIVVSDRDEIDSADLKIIEEALAAHSEGVTEGVATEDIPTGLHLFNVHVTSDTESASSPILDALKCLAPGFSMKSSPSGGEGAAKSVIFAIFEYVCPPPFASLTRPLTIFSCAATSAMRWVQQSSSR